MKDKVKKELEDELLDIIDSLDNVCDDYEDNEIGERNWEYCLDASQIISLRDALNLINDDWEKFIEDYNYLYNGILVSPKEMRRYVHAVYNLLRETAEY